MNPAIEAIVQKSAPSLVGLRFNETGAHRILLQGPPGSRKTTSALSFPNPLVINVDNKLPRDRRVPNVPMYDPEYRRTLFKAHKADPAFENLRDAFRLWLEKEMPKVDHENTTLIIDSWTMINNGCDTQGMKDRKISPKTGEYDTRAMWGDKLHYCFYVHELLKTYRGILISICHEYVDRDERGQQITAATPLFTGGFKDQFASHYSNHWRMRAEAIKGADGKDTGEVNYFWQVRSSLTFNAICSFASKTDKQYLPADYESIKDLIKNEPQPQP